MKCDPWIQSRYGRKDACIGGENIAIDVARSAARQIKDMGSMSA